MSLHLSDVSPIGLSRRYARASLARDVTSLLTAAPSGECNYATMSATYRKTNRHRLIRWQNSHKTHLNTCATSLLS